MNFANQLSVILGVILLFQTQVQDAQNSIVDFQIRILPEGTSLNFKLGRNQVLTCMVPAAANNQKPSLYWEINGARITEKSLSARVRVQEGANGDLMLRVGNVLEGDQGSYKCFAVLGTQTDSRGITVQVLQDLKILSDSEQFGMFGQDGRVECEAQSLPPAVIIWKNADYSRIENSEKYIIQHNSLVIKNLDNNDAKHYICDIAVMETGDGFILDINFAVITPPVIDMIPTIEPNNPKVGEPIVRITCHATGIPPPTYEFRKDNNIVSEADVDVQNGIWTIRNLQKEDEAVITCVAKNKGGSDQKSNTLDVKIPPIIEDIADVKNVEGGQVEVTCRAAGDPVPTVLWNKQGQPPYPLDGIKDSGPQMMDLDTEDQQNAEIKRNGKIMRFDNIKAQDAGVYICTALNVVGNASKSMEFEVRYKPHFDTSFKQTKFYGWKGHTANLTCLVSANEPASILWYHIKDNQTIRIENTAPYVVNTVQQWPEYSLSSGSLMVYASDERSPVFKDYICEATNPLGSAQQTVTLLRALTPGSPVVQVPSIYPTCVIVEVEAPMDNGGQSVSGYQYSYYPASDSASTITKDIDSTSQPTILQLLDLRPSTSYVIRTSARNLVGLGTAISVSFQTKNVTAPSKLEIKSPPEGSEPTSYTVEWAKPDDGGAAITQFNIKSGKVTVTGSDSSQWRVTGDAVTAFTVWTVNNPNALSFTIPNLERDTFYEIRITAQNSQGESSEAFKIIKTSQGANVTNVTAPVYETTTKSPVTVSANETTTKSSVNNATEISNETFRNDFRCGETAIEVFIPAYLVPNSQLTLRDESCKLVNNGTHYVISFPYNQCGTSEIFYSQQILVTNEIKVQSTLKYVDSGPVKFVTDYTIPLNCFPGGNQTVSSVLQILAPEKFQEGVLPNARFEIREFRSANYQEQITAYPVKLPFNREIYFELALTNVRPNTNSSIQVSKCQATPSNNPNDKTNYLLVSNGCSASPAVQILPRPSPDLFRFSSQAFQFSNGTDLIYVHCYVSVCSSGQCTLPCGRARRSLRGRLQSDLVTLTSSGFQVVTE